ncbi:Uma2 family endonuclease [Ornithinimicrobium sp. F0845]|uniref:Uma2 family endonuclease n=1 Tax=Ornithinimicrobium sp. F0845 TaxID=2926412 RepID=UPI001FF3916E|nr:Uma2 family endonuclease [Ornithinimicrobium sp. F0845]MCK0110586.1 Uma2 family endonuclease [Ornithinimicrobium sp. F0845]
MTVIPHAGPMTREDLEELRSAQGESAIRYELLDGSILVTPAPGRWHQTAAFGLARLLHEHKPHELVVLMAPFDVDLSEDTSLQPDILVARRGDLTDRNLPTAPVLAVEVLSPSTRRIDLTLKRDRFREAGCASYWTVDPLVPSVTMWELQEGTYERVVVAQGDQPVAVTTPFPVRLTPSALLAD